MRRTESVWEAVSLLAFANLRVSEANWRSLWDIHGERHPASYWGNRISRLAGPTKLRIDFRTGRLSGKGSRAYLAAHRRVCVERYEEGGELWAAYVKEVRRYGQPPYPAIDFQARTQVVDRLGTTNLWEANVPTSWTRSPVTRWPQKSDDGRPVGLHELVRLHGETRAHLARLANADAESWETVAKHVSRVRTKAERLVWLIPRDDPRHARFALAETRSSKRSLGAYIEGLFVAAAVAGLWSRIGQCPQCDRFILRLTRGEHATRYCSSACRARADRQRRAEEKKNLSRKVFARWLEVNRDVVRVCEEFRLTRRQVRALLR